MDLTHLDPKGGVRMVDVGHKTATARKAVARGSVRMKPETLRLICSQNIPKGDVLGIAQVAGIMAAKKTQELIPLCHQIELSGVNLTFTPEPDDAQGPSINVEAAVSVTGKTGAEMEALTAVSVACLTIYDMCKAVDKQMTIGNIRLLSKSGGKSGAYVREGEEIG